MERSTEISAARIAHRHGKNNWIRFFIATIFMSACTMRKPVDIVSLPYYNSPAFTALWPGEDHFTTDTLHTIQSFSFTDQDNNAVSNKTIDGKIYVANFFFTACGGICPKMIDNMKTVADTFKENPAVVFLSHSVTPEKDSVSVLKKYAADHGISANNWHLLTGNSVTINNIARQSYFIEKLPGISKDGTEFLHTENMVLVDRKGHIRGLYKGTLLLDAGRLIEDINILLKEP